MLVAIGGFDPGGGAGVVRDFLTGRTLGADVRLIPTAWTEQSSGGVHSIEPRQSAALGRAIRDALSFLCQAGGDGPASGAVKIGMLPDSAAARAVNDSLRGFSGPVVMDPVLSSSSGGRLYGGERGDLFAIGARATLVTPNAEEAAELTGLVVRDVSGAIAAARLLHAEGWSAVLVKGGHLSGDLAVDVLVVGGETHLFESRRLSGRSPRGTGCALASAIAIGLARGAPLFAAIGDAKAWLAESLDKAVSRNGEWHLS